MRLSRSWFVSLVMLCGAAYAGGALADSARPSETRRSQLCRKHLDGHLGTSLDDVAKSLDKEVEGYQRVVEEMMSYRTETIEAAKQLKKQVRELKKGVAAKDVDRFNQASLSHLSLRKKLQNFVEGHDCWVELAEDERVKAGLTEQTRLKGVLLSLSASLILYDNYLLSVSLYEQDSKLRKALKKMGSGFDHGRTEEVLLTLEYGSEETRKEAVAACSFYESAKKTVAPDARRDPQMAYLEKLISESPSYRRYSDVASRPLFGKGLEFFGAVTHDALASLEAQNVDLFGVLFADAQIPPEFRGIKLPEPQEVSSSFTPAPESEFTPKKKVISKPKPKAKVKAKAKAKAKARAAPKVKTKSKAARKAGPKATPKATTKTAPKVTSQTKPPKTQQK